LRQGPDAAGNHSFWSNTLPIGEEKIERIKIQQIRTSALEFKICRNNNGHNSNIYQTGAKGFFEKYECFKAKLG